MKKIIYIFLSSIIIFSLFGCGNNDNENNNEQTSVIVEESEIKEIEPSPILDEEIQTIRLNGINYYETNRTINNIEEVTENTITGEIKSFVSRDKFPEEDEQSNFGVGYQYQVKDENFTYVNINGVWHIFCSCDDAEGVIQFHDRTFMKEELSSETLEWLQKYNELSEDEQLAIDSIPAELIDEVIFDVEETEIGKNVEENQEKGINKEDISVEDSAGTNQKNTNTTQENSASESSEATIEKK